MTEMALTVPQSTEVVTKEQNDVFAALAGSGGKFLPRIQYMSGASACVKMRKFPSDHFALVTGKDQNMDIGEEFDCLVLAFRSKALDTKDPDGIVTCYDPKLQDGKFTGVFADIANRADVKDSGCMFGPEYLLWLPAQKKFATFFFASKTMRNEAPLMQEKLGKGATIGSQFIDTGSYQYNSPQVKDCNTVFELPSQEEVDTECKKFLNPETEDNGVEKVVDEAPDGATATGRVQ